MPKVLDDFCGEGGAGWGYHLAGFEVVGVDNAPARLEHYPFESHKADAIEFILEHGHEFDVIHASPPCTGYSRGTAAIPDRLTRYDRLIAATREACRIVGKPYVIENVEDAKRELIDPMTLCWTHFSDPGSVTDTDGTPLWMRRHRLFESSVPLVSPGPCCTCQSGCSKAMCGHGGGRFQCAGAYGGARRDKVEAREIRKGGYAPSVEVMRQLLGTPWMTEKGCQLSIPPAYAAFVGLQVMAHITG